MIGKLNRVDKDVASGQTTQDLPAHKLPNKIQPLHYADLLGKGAWLRLHPAIRRRFSQDQNATYYGNMKKVYLSSIGKILAQLCRLLGTPLALYSANNVPTVVNVFHNPKLGGYTWERLYKFPNKVNRVTSTKCLTNDPGLIEVLGRGVGMTLKTTEDKGRIYFSSVGFFWRILNRHIPLPHVFSAVVCQTALDDKHFTFELNITHPIFGVIAYQYGEFSEQE
ncbi:DUF4166 domain-containing protein [Agarilytica rhodophyticola]|uniref:DUF4166 domain-containing protein n=1 Tax=Agarilytica rhodophyticola TaxID=1737490 RepID=UPI000B346263|nr:DUF4166 domain-containing protein [Agarilytica rhodophyticola]